MLQNDILSNITLCLKEFLRAKPEAQPSECGRQRTLNIVHAQTAAQQQSNVSYEAKDVREMWRVERLVYHDFIHNPLGPSER